MSEIEVGAPFKKESFVGSIRSSINLSGLDNLEMSLVLQEILSE